MEVIKSNESSICTYDNRDQIMEFIEETKEQK